MPKSIFRRFIFDAFFERALTSILGGFSEPRNLKNQQKQLFFSMVFVNFHKIDVFKKVEKNHGFGIHFWRPKQRKSVKFWC